MYRKDCDRVSADYGLLIKSLVDGCCGGRAEMNRKEQGRGEA